MVGMQNFKNLRVYEDAFSLSKELYQFFDDKKMSFRTKEQLLASASSICANLAEMAAFESRNQMRQKVITCIGEANETEFWLNLTHELKNPSAAGALGLYEQAGQGSLDALQPEEEHGG